MPPLYNTYCDEKGDEEEYFVIKFADYETFKSYVLRKCDQIYENFNYEKENISYYRVKWIHFINRKVPILLQNKNGPCPLLCIANILSLRNQLYMDKETSKVSQIIIESKIMDIVLESNKNNLIDNKSSSYYRKNILESVEILPQLKYGLDINCKFTNIDAFEYTKGMCIFDMLNIPLYHGWVISPDDLTFYPYLKDSSYNVIINKIVRYNEYYEKKDKNCIESLNEYSNHKKKENTLNNEKKDENCIELLNEYSNHKKKEDTLNNEKKEIKENQKTDSNNVPVFPDDIIKNSDENNKMELFQNDIAQEKDAPFLNNKNNEVNYIKKISTNNNIKTSYASNYKNKIESYDKLLNTSPSITSNNINDSNINNLSFDGENENFFYTNKNVSNNKSLDNYKYGGDDYPLNIPKFPENTIPTDNSTINDFYCKNVESNTKTFINKVQKNDKRINNNDLFLDSNDVISLSNNINEEKLIDSISDTDKIYTMNNFNSVINLTPYEINEAIIMSEFLEKYKTQLTLGGLKLLKKNMNQNQLVAFFRNNHYSTLFKYENNLFLLANDISFLYLSCTWELFDNVENNTSYYDQSFKSLSSQRNLKNNIDIYNEYSKNIKKKFGKSIIYQNSNSSVQEKKEKKKKCNVM